MADLLATIGNIGIVPVLGTLLVIVLLITAFTHGGPKGGGSGKKTGSGSNSGKETTDGGSK